MAGVGLAFVVEISDKAIRRSSDIFAIVDSKLIVSIPYIITTTEARRRKRLTIMLLLGSISLLAGLVIVTYFFLPPLDLMIAKARVGLFR